MKTAIVCLLALSVGSAISAAEPFAAHKLQLVQPGKALVADPFTQPELAGRRLTRGAWVVKDGVASCAHDEALFKQYKNHGPAIWYDKEFRDGLVRFEFQPSAECKHFVFTVNGPVGHVLRFVMNEAGTDVRAWDANHKGKQLAKAGPKLPKDAWTPVTVEITGDQACVHIGADYQVTVTDPSYDVPKNVVGVSFHYGDVKLRNFELLEATAK